MSRSQPSNLMVRGSSHERFEKPIQTLEQEQEQEREQEREQEQEHLGKANEERTCGS